MGRVIPLRNQCTGACEQAMGCDCHPTAGTYAPPAAPDQPLQTMPGDLGEHHTAPKGTCWICALTWIVAGMAAAAFVMFVGNVLTDLGKRLLP